MPLTRDIRRRLEKLESQVLPQPTEQEKKMRLWEWLLLYAVVYYLGGPAPDGDQRNRLRAPMRGRWDIRVRLNFERPAKPKMQTLVRGCAWPTTNY